MKGDLVKDLDIMPEKVKDLFVSGSFPPQKLG
jgi:hypothetical protein